MQTFDAHISTLKDAAYEIRTLLPTLNLFIKWTCLLGARSGPTLSLVPTMLGDIRANVKHVIMHGSQPPPNPQVVPAAGGAAAAAGGLGGNGAGAAGAAAAGGGGAAGAAAVPLAVPVAAPVAAPAPAVPVGTAAQKSRVKAIAAALLKAFDEYYPPEWLEFDRIRIAAVLDIRTVKTNRGGGKAAVDEFHTVMDMIEDPAFDFITAAERDAPAAAAAAVDPFAAAALANAAEVEQLSPFRKEVKLLLAAITAVPLGVAAEMDPLDFLRSLEMPIIKRVARTALAPPAESVDAERLFSLAGIIVSKLRAALAPETAEMQILLSSWLRRDAEVVKVVPEMLDNMVENTEVLDFLSAAAEAESDNEADA